jgi:hypothetical protein
MAQSLRSPANTGQGLLQKPGGGVIFRGGMGLVSQVVSNCPLWCAKSSSTSRHHSFKPIFMMQSTENSLLSEPETFWDFVCSHQCRWQSFRRIRNPGSKAQMRTTSIVMNHPFSDESPHLSLAQGNQPVQTLPPQTADQAFAVSVRFRSLNRSFHRSDAHSFQGPVQFRRKDSRSIMNQPSVR